MLDDDNCISQSRCRNGVLGRPGESRWRNCNLQLFKVHLLFALIILLSLPRGELGIERPLPPCNAPIRSPASSPQLPQELGYVRLIVKPACASAAPFAAPFTAASTASSPSSAAPAVVHIRQESANGMTMIFMGHRRRHVQQQQGRKGAAHRSPPKGKDPSIQGGVDSL